MWPACPALLRAQQPPLPGARRGLEARLLHMLTVAVALLRGADMGEACTRDAPPPPLLYFLAPLLLLTARGRRSLEWALLKVSAAGGSATMRRPGCS